jgi:pimeloyl-ACP methyl ester carboxylesterase
MEDRMDVRTGAALAFRLLGIMMFACSAGDVSASTHEDAAPPCPAAAWAMADGTTLDIAPGDHGTLRWRRPDGTTGVLKPRGRGRWTSTYGWTGRPDGHHVVLRDCGRAGIRFDGTRGRRIPLVQTDTRFQGSGVELAGRLTLPPGDARVPLVVLVHGAEHSSALHDYSLQREFASHGIGVFAYDKRGTGASGGRYTQDYLTLAVDAIHAMHEAKRLAGARAGRVGYQGGSQGGWVVPLAARIEPVDFAIVSFGLAVSPLEEDREAVAFDLERAGFDADAQAKAMTISDAAIAIVESDFTEGYDRLEALKKQYANEPWFTSVRGNITGYLLAATPEVARRDLRALVAGIPVRYDPMPVLHNLDVPQLWVLGGQDRDAPPFETRRRLAALQAECRPITIAVFPNADHGIVEFETKPDGERVSTRRAAGYFDLMVAYIQGKALQAAYGTAELAPARR